MHDNYLRVPLGSSCTDTSCRSSSRGSSHRRTRRMLQSLKKKILHRHPEELNDHVSSQIPNSCSHSKPASSITSVPHRSTDRQQPPKSKQPKTKNWNEPENQQTKPVIKSLSNQPKSQWRRTSTFLDERPYPHDPRANDEEMVVFKPPPPPRKIRFAIDEEKDPRKRVVLQPFTHPDGFTLSPVKTLGTGSFGRVYLVQTPDGTPYALKRYKKKKLMDKRQEDHIQREASVLRMICHPFIVNMECCFRDAKNVYMLLEFVQGGEFFSLVRNAGRLEDRHACFFASQVAMVFEYLHSIGIVYRDLKPENLLVDYRGYLKLTDFGFAKEITDRTYTVCGTPEYFAPELIAKTGHGFPVDWWTLGVLIYEMLTGNAPFGESDSVNVQEVYNAIMKKPVFIDHKIFNKQSADLINGLLERNPKHRLGSPKCGEVITENPWFGGIDWDVLLKRGYTPPTMPMLSGASDTKYFEQFDERTDDGEEVLDDDVFDFFPSTDLRLSKYLRRSSLGQIQK